MNRDSDRTAVIIGASSGIGAALAHQLNREGWRVGLLARRLDRLEALRQTLAPETVMRRIDVMRDDAAGIWRGRAAFERGRSSRLAELGAPL